MRNDRGPRPGQSFRGGHGSPGGHQGGSRSDRIKAAVKAALQSTERVEYVAAEKPGPEFLDADARSQAERFEGLPPSQLRRFYGMATDFKRRLELDTEGRISESEVQAQMAHLKASAAYAAMRNQPEELVRFFTVHANSVSTPAHYRIFCRHFEAVVAYHKVFGRERRD
jgi:CRISPR-associated protein Csm2